jgi:uncharacterized protein (DUF1501 family)
MSAISSTRRALLGASLLSPLGLLLSPCTASAEEARGTKTLLCVFLRGAADGLNIVVPHSDDAYYRLRPSIAVPRPTERDGALDLDGRYGLHPRLKPLLAAYQAGELVLLQAVGSPHPTRSHFEAQDFMETGAVGDRGASRGWLGRYLSSESETAAPLRAVALSSRAPLALRGYSNVVATPSLRELGLNASPALEPALRQGFARLYSGADSRVADRAAERALLATETIDRALRAQRSRARYARDTQSFADLARLIKADVGLRVAWLDLTGWDTHRSQGSVENGDLPRQLDRLGRGLSALRADLGEAFERVVVVVMTEFGRTVKENGTGGTDHGHGSAMLVLGGKVRGGRVVGDLPGLAGDELYQGRDVPVRIDFRQVLSEICEKHLGVVGAASLFPGFQGDGAPALALL